MKKANFDESRIKPKSATRMPCLVKYHPRPKTLSKSIHKNLNLLYMNYEIKCTVTPRFMVPFKTARKLSSYRVRAKLYPLERTVRSWKCSKKRFDVCENVENSDTFRSSVTSETFKINHRLDL